MIEKTIYASDLTAKLVVEKAASMKADLLNWNKAPHLQRFRDAYKLLVFTPPDHTFKLEEGLMFNLGNEVIEVFYPGPGHSVDNVVVYFKKRRILFGGCLVKPLSSRNLGNLADANVDEWPASIKRVQEKYPQCRIVIPGHGDYGDIKLLQHTIDLLVSSPPRK